ncbi:MAG: hypothetical protein ACLTBV_10585 [Enterocloster bolteae]
MKESLYAAADIGATGTKMAAAVHDGRKLRMSGYIFRAQPSQR